MRASAIQERSRRPRTAGAGSPASCRYESSGRAAGDGAAYSAASQSVTSPASVPAAISSAMPASQISRYIGWASETGKARVLARGIGEVGQRGNGRCPERAGEPAGQLRIGHQIDAGRARPREAGEHPLQREEMIVLALVPHAVRAEAVHEMGAEPGVDLSEVELVLIVAEPGDPHAGEHHSGLERLESAYEYATKVCRDGKDPFHRNILKILNACWPVLPFDEQALKVWVTELVLCSAVKEGAPVFRSCEMACGERYLKAQLGLFPDALIVTLGRKAQRRLRQLGLDGAFAAWSVAPPGCNRPEAHEFWMQIAIELKHRRHAVQPRT